jgi:chorismate mutase
MAQANRITPKDAVSCVFTLTPDLHSAFPALAARQAGCSTAELELVVEMAQALGGGPSERLGRKVLGS